MMFTIGKRMKTATPNERGLTLIELCVTLLVLGLIAALASPRLTHAYYHLRLKTTAEEIVDAMTMAGRRAIFSGQPWRLRVSPEGDCYFIEQQMTDIDSEQPVWNWPADWRIEIRKVLDDGLRLTPTGESFTWIPGGAPPCGKLVVSDGSGRSHTIHLEATGIMFQQTDKPR